MIKIRIIPITKQLKMKQINHSNFYESYAPDSFKLDGRIYYIEGIRVFDISIQYVDEVGNKSRKRNIVKGWKLDFPIEELGAQIIFIATLMNELYPENSEYVLKNMNYFLNLSDEKISKEEIA